MTFKEKVYELTRRIPRGKVATYGQIARAIGCPRAARAVGGCMKTNPFAPVVPCHRVVAADGSLAGFSAGGGIATKKQLLLKEGVVFIGERVDLRKSGVSLAELGGYRRDSIRQ